MELARQWSHKGRFYDIPEMSITPRPVQKPIPFYVASFSKTSLEMAAKRGLNIIYAPFAAGMVFGGLDKAVETYREACVKAGQKPGRAMCSYFIYIADDDEEEDYGRETQMDYFNHCVLQAFPQKKEDAPPTMQYFMKIVDILKNMKKEDLSDKSILLGPPQKIIESLKKVEKAGIEEVILYFNVGNKPHSPGQGADAPLHEGNRAALPGQAHRADEGRRLTVGRSVAPPRAARPPDFRSALGCFPTGVCLITTLGPDGKPEGLTINSFSSVSLDPPMVLWSLARTASSAPVFRDAEYFAVNILAKDDAALSSHFARSCADKFAAFAGTFCPGWAEFRC